MIKGYLNLIVLKTLSSKHMSGYSLIKEIEKTTGCWKPSTGSIYPLLDTFKKHGFVTVKQAGRKKLYSVTDKGRENLKLLTETKNQIIDKLIEGWKVFESVSDKHDTDFMIEIFNKVKKGEMPFKDLHPEINDFRAILFRLFNENKMSNNKNEIKNILREANKKLRMLK